MLGGGLGKQVGASGVAIVGAFRRFRALSEFIQGGVVCAALALLFMSMYLYGVHQGPELRFEARAEMSGLFVAVGAGNQRGYNIVIKDSADGVRKRFYISPAYTSVDRDFSSKIGRQIKVQHFNRAVTKCLVDGVQLCTPACFTSQECQISKFEGDTIPLKWMAYTFLVLSLLCFISHFINKPTTRDESAG